MTAYTSLPNLITLVRLCLVPVVIAMISAGRWTEACLIFIAAGVSDAIDGWLAKTFNLQTELGAYLDPLADKALLVSIYVALAVFGAVPSWLTILCRRARCHDYRRVHDFLADEQAGGDPPACGFPRRTRQRRSASRRRCSAPRHSNLPWAAVSRLHSCRRGIDAGLAGSLSGGLGAAHEPLRHRLSLKTR